MKSINLKFGNINKICYINKTEKNEFKQIQELFKDRGLNTKLSYGDTYNFE
jgi:hypothetical protein